jgi:hypothetical protein
MEMTDQPWEVPRGGSIASRDCYEKMWKNLELQYRETMATRVNAQKDDTLLC